MAIPDECVCLYEQCRAIRQQLAEALKELSKTTKPTPLFNTLFTQANFYNQGSQVVLGHGQATNNVGLAAPAILCQSFAIELLLKCFLLLPHQKVQKFGELKALGVDVRGHIYSSLFDRIDRRFQGLIAGEFSKRSGVATDAAAFRGHLVELGDEPFVIWRYVYEKPQDTYLNLELFGLVADALGVTADQEVKAARS
jgi:hypothetical protein